MKLSVTQRGFERLDLLPIRPTEGLLDSGEGSAHLNTNETRALASCVSDSLSRRRKEDCKS